MVADTQSKEKTLEEEDDGKKSASQYLIRPANELPLTEVRKILRLNGPDDIRFYLRNP